jgi:glutamate 5-kinase
MGDAASAVPASGRPLVVVKIGTSSLVDVVTLRPRLSALARLAEAVCALRSAGASVIVVSSGAVGLGVSRLGLRERPAGLAGKQAAAAVGQSRLMSLWDHAFDAAGGARVAQVLLTYETFGERSAYLNARNTFAEVLRLGAVPIVNENDTVAVQELRVGDNDSLSALVAAMVSADWLLLLTDVDALYDANPRDAHDAAPIRLVPAHAIGDLRRQMVAGAPRLRVREEEAATVAAVEAAAAVGAAGDSEAAAVTRAASPPPRKSPPAVAPAPAAAAPPPSPGRAGTQFGTGGMVTKVKAAQLASAAGVTTVIAETGRIEEVVAALIATRAARLPDAPSAAAHRLFSELGLGTTFLPSSKPLKGRKRWIAGLAPAGTVTVDAGAVAALVGHSSLFPAGVLRVTGAFDSHDAVSICDEAGREVARALVNFAADDLRRIRGKSSGDIAALLGYEGAEAVADRDNVCLVLAESELKGEAA